MEKTTKDMSVVESSIQKWYDAETERLVSKGEDINNIFIVADPYYNEGTIICDDYTLGFNRDECVVDLVVKGEKNSSIWDDVVNNVPVQFVSCIDNPMSFTYNISANTSGEKESYLFSVVGFNNFMPLFGLIPLHQVEEEIEEKRKNLGSMIADLLI